MNGEKILDLTWGTILKFLIAIFILYAIFILRDFLIWFIFALIISLILDWPIDVLKKIKIPRAVGTIFIYFAIFGLFGYLIYIIAHPLIFEIKQFSQNFPIYFEKVSPILGKVGIQAEGNFTGLVDTLKNFLEKSSSSVLNAIFSIFGGIFTTLFIISIAMFLSFEHKFGERSLVLFFPKKDEAYLVVLWEKIKNKVSLWFISRILASLFIGVATYLILFFLSINYPISLGILAGVLNFIPIIGPLLTGAILFIIVFPQSFTMAVYVIIIFSVIQQIEGSVFTPIVTKKFIGLPPVLVILALAIGGKLWGITGAILTIPFAGILFEFLKNYLKRRREERAVIL